MYNNSKQIEKPLPTDQVIGVLSKFNLFICKLFINYIVSYFQEYIQLEI